jgi:hypothetical protein
MLHLRRMKFLYLRQLYITAPQNRRRPEEQGNYFLTWGSYKLEYVIFHFFVIHDDDDDDDDVDDDDDGDGDDDDGNG